MQLVSYGAQDIYISGNPQITFFKVVYRRYTNFAIESIQQTINGSIGYGNKVSTQISRNGDLITDIFCEITLKKTAGTGSTFYPAEALLYDVIWNYNSTYTGLQVGGPHTTPRIANVSLSHSRGTTLSRSISSTSERCLLTWHFLSG